MLSSVNPVTVKKISIFLFRADVDKPVRTLFGSLNSRPGVIIRIEDADGAFGYGEAWCNFPPCGAEHRGRLLETIIAPMLLNTTVCSPEAAFADLTAKVRLIALQADEPGPLSQAVAAADIALWDLFSRKAGLPLHRALGGAGRKALPAYASGIDASEVLPVMEESRKLGYRAFKFKVTLNQELNQRNIDAAVAWLHPGETVAVDANQSYDLPTALRFAESMQGAPLQWLEEPLACDSHISQWEILREHCTIPLAGGENVRRSDDFYAIIHHRAFAVVQPDICKWGGLSGTLPIARAVLAAGLRYCPHYLGGGIGLMASAHLLSAVGGDGLLEIDANPNPLREGLAYPFPPLKNGNFMLSDKPGLGVEPDFAVLSPFLVWQREVY